MREIKFKVRDGERMEEVKDLHFCPTSGGTLITGYRIESSHMGIAYTDYYPEKDKHAFLQYTGLKDSNGVEIYEGDVITYVGYTAYGRDKMKVSKLIVERDDLDGGFNLGRLFERDQGDIGLSNENITVVGNIYENPTEVT